MNPASAFRRGSAGLMPTGYVAGVSFLLADVTCRRPTSDRTRRSSGSSPTGRCVVLDGGTATELQRVLPSTVERGERRPLGQLGALPRSGSGARRPSLVRRRGLRCRLDEHVVRARRDAGRRARRCRPAALDGHRAQRHPARANGSVGGRATARGRVLALGGRRVALPQRYDQPAREDLRRRATRPDPARDALADPRARDVHTRRGAPRARASPSGSRSAAAVTASAASTASTGARRRATSSAAPRAASRRWASAHCSSTACPSITCPAWSAGSATSRSCRSASTPTSVT